jgi:hypothetical protein
MTQLNKPEFEAVYRATTYRVDAPQRPIDIRVGQTHSLLDALLEQLGATDWAFVTAWNPRSVATSAEINGLAQRQLIEEVRARGWVFFEGAGIPDHPGWSAERSLWIAGITWQEAAALGALFGQNAVLAGTAGGRADLVFCEPPAEK